jgi:hypothetical protein
MPDPHERLRRALEGLNSWEQEIVLREMESISEGLHRGLATYGHWDPQKDTRDHEADAEMEDVDRRVYTHMKHITAETKADTIPAPPNH